jgi:hypothetical protein
MPTHLLTYAACMLHCRKDTDKVISYKDVSKETFGERVWHLKLPLVLLPMPTCTVHALHGILPMSCASHWCSLVQHSLPQPPAFSVASAALCAAHMWHTPLLMFLLHVTKLQLLHPCTPLCPSTCTTLLSLSVTATGVPVADLGGPYSADTLALATNISKYIDVVSLLPPPPLAPPTHPASLSPP